MPTKTQEQTETEARARWTALGLNERVQDDLINLAAELADVLQVPVTEALGTIEAESREVMETRILHRVADTITYNGDLKRAYGGDGGGEA
jgi:hypothetical protein